MKWILNFNLTGIFLIIILLFNLIRSIYIQDENISFISYIYLVDSNFFILYDLIFFKISTIWSNINYNIYWYILIIYILDQVLNMYNIKYLNFKNLVFFSKLLNIFLSSLCIYYYFFFFNNFNFFQLKYVEFDILINTFIASFNPLLRDNLVFLHPLLIWLFFIIFFFLFLNNIIEYLNEYFAYYLFFIYKKHIILFFCYNIITFAIILGSFWAYKELGWNGLWMWDPVELFSFLIWLLMLIYIHTNLILNHKFSYLFNNLAITYNIYKNTFLIKYSSYMNYNILNINLNLYLQSLCLFILLLLTIRLNLLNSVHNFVMINLINNIFTFFVIIFFIIFKGIILLILINNLIKFLFFQKKNLTLIKNFNIFFEKRYLINFLCIIYFCFNFFLIIFFFNYIYIFLNKKNFEFFLFIYDFIFQFFLYFFIFSVFQKIFNKIYLYFNINYFKNQLIYLYTFCITVLILIFIFNLLLFIFLIFSIFLYFFITKKKYIFFHVIYLFLSIYYLYVCIKEINYYNKIIQFELSNENFFFYNLDHLSNLFFFLGNKSLNSNIFFEFLTLKFFIFSNFEWQVFKLNLNTYLLNNINYNLTIYDYYTNYNNKFFTNLLFFKDNIILSFFTIDYQIIFTNLSVTFSFKLYSLMLLTILFLILILFKYIYLNKIKIKNNIILCY